MLYNNKQRNRHFVTHENKSELSAILRQAFATKLIENQILLYVKVQNDISLVKTFSGWAPKQSPERHHEEELTAL